ncbi:amidase [Paenibacillus piri]|uniref:Amidase n=2 Tax=Paenibacillus piri TaxID=2547395 RepID=A0A4V2ZST9_9BACL|nr:amidase [Paenibacillus piri]TDF94474.1 amidase [Paenibacillus piri]
MTYAHENLDSWGALIGGSPALEPTPAAAGGGKLAGMSYAVKDVYDIQGHIAGAGCPDWRRTHGPAARTAPAVRQLLQDGAQLVGLAHTDELMFSLNGENEHYGTPINPKAHGRIPGGSSSGSAVAVAGGLADFALGTDTAGSIRIPASYCGIYGFRPTHGAVSLEGVIPLAPSFDTVGWMANDAPTLFRVGQSLLAGAAPTRRSFTRLLLPEDAWQLADIPCREQLAALIPRLDGLLDRREPIMLAENGLQQWLTSFRTVQGFEIWQTHGPWIEQYQPKLGSQTAARFAWTRTVTEEAYREHLLQLEGIRQTLRSLLGGDTLLMLPTAPGVAPLCGLSGEQMEPRRVSTMQLTCIAGLGGLPQITLPWAVQDGIPLGLSVIAGPGQDLQLLAWVQEWSERIGIA